MAAYFTPYYVANVISYFSSSCIFLTRIFTPYFKVVICTAAYFICYCLKSLVAAYFILYCIFIACMVAYFTPTCIFLICNTAYSPLVHIYLLHDDIFNYLVPVSPQHISIFHTFLHIYHLYGSALHFIPVHRFQIFGLIFTLCFVKKKPEWKVYYCRFCPHCSHLLTYITPVSKDHARHMYTCKSGPATPAIWTHLLSANI
jgi:hypothetical protein